MRRIAILALLIVAPPASAADVKLADVPEPVTLSARGGMLAYSRFDAGQWKLVLWENGVARDAPVAPRSAPFDVDLGFYPGGSVAVYSRCEGRATCDLFIHHIHRGDEERLARVSSRTRHERRPVVHGSQILFQRGNRFMAGDFEGDGPIRQVRSFVPDGYDLVGGRMAWTRLRPNRDSEGRNVSLYVGRPDGGDRLLERSTSGALSRAEMTRPVISGRYVFTAKVRRGSAGQRFLRVNLRTREQTEARGRRNVLAAVPLGSRVAYLQSTDDYATGCQAPGGTPANCAIHLTDPLTFR